MAEIFVPFTCLLYVRDRLTMVADALSPGNLAECRVRLGHMAVRNVAASGVGDRQLDVIGAGR
jgi:hypothetical protein